MSRGSGFCSHGFCLISQKNLSNLINQKERVAKKGSMPPKRVASSSRGASASGGSKNKLKRKRETVSPTGPIRPKAKPVDAEPPTVSVRRPTSK